MPSEIKFSPTEQKALAKYFHKGQKRIGGKDYICHPIEVAELLYHYKLRGEYVFTAFCHDLLEDTDVKEEEILDTCGRFTLAAVKLLTKRRKNEPGKKVDMNTYLEAIKDDDVAYQVKVADRTMNLWSLREADLEFREKYLKETEKYYLDFAKESILFDEMELAYKTIKNETDILNRAQILVEIEEIIDDMPEKESVLIYGFNYDYDDTFPLLCEFSRKDLKFLDSGTKSTNMPSLVAAMPEPNAAEYEDAPVLFTGLLKAFGYPHLEVQRYSSVEEYKEKTNDPEGLSPASQSILYHFSDPPKPFALITGVVRGISGEFEVENDGENISMIGVYLEVMGPIISIGLEKIQFHDIGPGEVISGMFYLCADPVQSARG